MAASTFEKLLDRHYDEVLRYSVRNLGDATRAEDVCQETFLRAYRAYGTLPAEANHRAWLYKIASNLCADAHRERARGPVALDESLAAPASADGARHLVGEIVSFVRTLPARQRQALILRKFQGLEYAEIAAALGGSEGTARANVYQALRKVRAEFKDRRYG